MMGKYIRYRLYMEHMGYYDLAKLVHKTTITIVYDTLLLL
jgi:hypothetical protein